MHDWVYGGRNNHWHHGCCPFSCCSKNITRADLDATFGLETAPVTGGVSLEAKPLLELGEAAGLGISH